MDILSMPDWQADKCGFGSYKCKIKVLFKRGGSCIGVSLASVQETIFKSPAHSILVFLRFTVISMLRRRYLCWL